MKYEKVIIVQAKDKQQFLNYSLQKQLQRKILNSQLFIVKYDNNMRVLKDIKGMFKVDQDGSFWQNFKNAYRIKDDQDERT